MTNRKGAGRGTGKGYKNLRSFPRDASIHSQSAKGRKQPQRLFNIKLLRVPYGKEYAPLHWREYTMKPGGAVGTIKEFDDFFEGQNVTFDVDMTMQEKKALTKKSKLKDTDKDGVADVLDCRKYNPNMQDDWKLGDVVKVSSENDNENYDSFRGKKLIITHVATNEDEHPGYDEGVGGEKLYNFKTEDGKEVPFSLYEYELEDV